MKIITRFCLLFVFLIFSGLPLLGQSVQFSGHVIDANTQQPLAYATLVLLDSSGNIVTGGVTDGQGNFSLSAPDGQYNLKAEYISYSSKTLENVAPNDARLSSIALNIDATQLQEVEVTAEEPRMELSLDKKIYRVDKDLNNVGGNASEVLDNVPSVTVDIDGNVALRGSGNVRILIDGKPSGLTGLGSTNALRNIPAGNIESVEVITNPSARYDAEGMSGIINIVLKKQRSNGFNASLNFGTGIPDNHSLAGNLNYRSNKVNFFTNLGGSYRGGPGSGFNYFEYYNNNPFPISNQDRSHDRGGWAARTNLGMEYFLAEKTTLTGSFGYSYGEQDNESSLLYSDSNIDLGDTQSSFRNEDEKEDEHNLSYALNFTKDFKEKGRRLNADVKYEQSGEKETSDLFEDFISGSPTSTLPLSQRTSNDENQDELLLQIDYVYPFSKTHKFEIGGKSTLRGITNDYIGEQLNSGQWEVIPGITNDFAYNEDIVAGYGIYANEVGKFSYQVGARLEFTDILTELKTTGEENARDYTNLFPSAFLTYKISDTDALQGSYSRRMRRPRFRELNPFFTFSDSRRRFGGNPNLNPEFSDSYELAVLNDWDFATLSSAVYYRKTDDVISRISRAINDTVVQFLPVNLAQRQSYGAEFIANKDFSKNFRIDGSLNLFQFKTDGGDLYNELSVDGFSWFGRMSSRFTIAENYTGQFRLNHRGAQESGQGKRKGITTADLGFSNELFKKTATLTLNARDLFNSRKYRYETLTDDFYNRGEFQWRSRSVTMGLNLRINQDKKRQRQGQDNQDFGEGGEF